MIAIEAARPVARVAIRPGRARVYVLGGLLVAIAFGIRAWGLTRANELFIDELTYSRLSLSVSHGQWPNLSGVPFYLHPPGSFYLNGAIIKILGLSHDPTDLVRQLRWVNATLGTITVGLAFLLLYRLTGPALAAGGALIVAVDPFVLRNDSRVMLETPAVTLLLAGWLVIVLALRRQHRSLLLCGGLLLGLAVLTKDVTAIPALLPLLLAPLWRRTMQARDAGIAFVAGILPYLIYIVTLAAAGRAGGWWHAKDGGLRRMLGLDQESGFNAAGAPSLVSTLVDQLSRFGSSYVLLALAVPAGLLAVLSRRPERRFVGIGTVLVGLLGLFALAFGTLEEQMGYFVVVPGVISLCIGFAEQPAFLVKWLRIRFVRPLVLAGACILLCGSIIYGVLARTVTDDGYFRAKSYMDSRLPGKARVAMTGPTGEFAFRTGEGHDLQIGTWASLSTLDSNYAQYVLTQSKPLSQGYGYSAPDLVPWLEKHATAVFSAHGPSGGDTVVWKLDRKAVAAAVRHGTTIPVVPSARRLGIR